MKTSASIAALMLVAAACVSHKGGTIDYTKINSFKVEITAGNLGTASVPLAFTSSSLSYSLTITAIDGMGGVVKNYAGPVTVSAQPGTVFGGQNLAFAQGVASGSITLKGAFGVTRIWVEDPPSLATGLSDAIYIRGPKIADVQTSPSTINSPFNGQRVIVDTASQLVVTDLGRDGFYITDVGVASGQFASIYAYTFGSPKGVQPGDRINRLQGTVSEFLGFTELNNPTWDSTGTTLPLPANKLLTCTDIGAASPNLDMESYESGLIEVDDAAVQVCGGYPTCPDYDQYRQWTLALNVGGCAINTVSNYTLPNFDPRANHGITVTKMKGTLRHIQFASPQWILEPHGPADVCCPTCTPAFNQGC